MKPVSIRKFLDMHRRLDHVKYRFGAKASFSTKPEHIKEIDCSGYARYEVFHATSGEVKMPDGSANQRDWCEDQGLRRLARYSDVQYAAHDPSRLFICFVRPLPGVAGHVWFVHQGKTYESHGKRTGVNSRGWNLLFAKLRGALAFEVPTAP